MIGFFYKNGMDKTQRFRMTPSTNNILENLVNTLSDQQMTRTEDIFCATISSHYHENARIRVIDFLRDSSKRMVTYGYSSGGSRAHMLYRSENGKLLLYSRLLNVANVCITSGRTCCMTSSKTTRTKSRTLMNIQRKRASSLHL